MIRCPYCHFDNEDGALYCDQCKSDLGNVVPAMPVQPVPVQAVPVQAVPVEAIPVEAVPVLAEPVEVVPSMSLEPGVPSLSLEGTPVMAEAVPVEAVPMDVVPVEAVPVEVVPFEGVPVEATPVQATPVQAVPVEAVPMEAMPVEATPAQTPSSGAGLPAGSQPRLLVLRGLKQNVEYPLFEGQNFVGRADEKPVDIDLEEQEPPDRIWCSRQHCVLFLENNELSIEDLNSSNGTFVNRVRIYPGQRKTLAVNDVIQIGNVQMKVVV